MDSTEQDFNLVAQYTPNIVNGLITSTGEPGRYSVLSPQSVTSLPDYDSYKPHSSPPAQQVPNPSTNGLEFEKCGSSPTMGDQFYFDDNKESSFVPSPFIGDDDPLLGTESWEQLTDLSEFFDTELEGY